MQNKPAETVRKTLKVEECAGILGIGKSTMYSLVHEALENEGKPFSVIELGGKLLVSRKSFNDYLESLNL